MPFFRHIGGVSGVAKNAAFGPKYFYKFWIRACKNLGVEGLDLYGGTRHTTATETARLMGHDAAKKATGHDTNKAFDRYCQAEDETAFNVADIVAQKTGRAKIVPITKVIRK